MKLFREKNVFNFISIIKENNSTFYDYGSNSPILIHRRIILEVLAAAIFSIWAPLVSDNFLLGIITAQSILIGFCFNVMFFLANNSNASDKPTSLEGSIRGEKLSKLSREIFFNLSYYNINALISLLASIIILAPCLKAEKILHLSGTLLNDYNFLFSICKDTVSFFLYFSALESGYTFTRIIGRVNYLFVNKL